MSSWTLVDHAHNLLLASLHPDSPYSTQMTMLPLQCYAQAFVHQPPSLPALSGFNINQLPRPSSSSSFLSMVAQSSSKSRSNSSTNRSRSSRTASPNSGRSNRTSRQSPQRPQQRHPQNPQKQKQKKPKVPVTEATSMGEAIQLAETISEHLYIVDNYVWLPTDDDLQPHLRTQLIHHEKRRRWGSQLLEGLGQAALNSWESSPNELRQRLFSLDGDIGKIWTDSRLVRAIMSVALPMGSGNDVDDERTTIDRPDKEGVWITAALKGLHVLSGCIAPVAPSSTSSMEDIQTWIDLHSAISKLIQSAEKLSLQSSLKDATEVRWAIRGLTSRMQMANQILSNDASDLGTISDESTLDFTTPHLNARTANLPFDIFSHCLPWQMNTSSPTGQYYGYPSQDLLPSLLQSIPFNFDTITTRMGNLVFERRGTAWIAEDGIGALAYSGKLMEPTQVSDEVGGIMRDMEKWCAEHKHGPPSIQLVEFGNSESVSKRVQFKWDEHASSLPYEELGQFLEPEYDDSADKLSAFFDCALCNHYPDGDSACKFHTDPEHGSLWHRTTAVVSCGTSRGFAFRPIPEKSTWSEWDNIDQSTLVTDKQQSENTPASLQLFPGDVVFMAGECNDLFHHAVYASPYDKMGIDSSRVSLVFKRALDRGGGKRGHGLRGEGRRSRQRNRRQ